MSDPLVSIIIPTRKRAQFPERLKTIIEMTPELIDHREYQLWICHDEDDSESFYKANEIYPYSKICTCKPLETPANKWNFAASLCHSKWLVTLSDDCIPQRDWLKNALNMLTHGFIGLPDGVTGDRNNYFTPLYMATRDWLKKYHGGVLVIPHYKSWYADIETARRAQISDTYMVGWNSVVKQVHAVFGTAPNDEIYRIGQMRQAEDLQMYNLRASKGFPDDFESVL